MFNFRVLHLILLALIATTGWIASSGHDGWQYTLGLAFLLIWWYDIR